MNRSLLKVFGKSTLSTLALLLAVVLVGQLVLAGIQYYTVGESGNDVFATDCEYVDVLQYTKSFIPESIQNAVKQQGYTLEVVEEVPLGKLGAWFYGFDEGMDGVCSPLTKKITVKAVGEDGPVKNNQFAVVFIHEYGHAVSYTYGHLSETKEFLKAYQEGLSKTTVMFNEYTLQNSSEYFAESFMAYIVARAQLRIQYPETAKFFDEFFANANNTPTRVGLITYETNAFHYMSDKIAVGTPLMVLVSILFGLFMVLKQYKLDKLNLTPPVSTTER